MSKTIYINPIKRILKSNSFKLSTNWSKSILYKKKNDHHCLEFVICEEGHLAKTENELKDLFPNLMSCKIQLRLSPQGILEKSVVTRFEPKNFLVSNL